MATVDTLQIEISASSEQAANAVNKLAESLAKLKNAIPNSNFKGFENLAKSLKQLGDTAKGMQDSIGALAKAANAVERLTSIKSVRIPKSIGDGIRNIGTAAEMVTPEAVENLDSMTRSLQRLQNVNMKGASQAFRSLGKGVKTFNESAVREEQEETRSLRATRDRLRERIRLSVDTRDLERVKNAAKAAWGHLKNLGNRIKLRIEAATIEKLKKRLEGIKTIVKSLGRIAFYRAIRSAIKAITQAFDEGLKNAYHFSAGLADAVDGRIAVALDSLSTKSLTMKNQLGAAFGSLLTALAPIINALIGLITALATAITQLFAAFSSGTFLKAKDTTAKFADDMKKGGGAAKEWKNQLMGFDEINRLEDNNGGGGGGGSSALDPNDMFEVENIDSAIKKFVDNLKSAVLAGEWETVGKLIGSKLNEVVRSIPWAKIGEKIGYYFNGAIQSLYYTLVEFDFVALGHDLADMLNRALEQVDFGTWGRLFVRKAISALELCFAFWGRLSWGDIGKRIGDFIRGALDEATKWIESKDWNEMGKTVSKNFIEMVEGLEPASLGAAFNIFFSKAFRALKEFIAGFDWSETFAALKENWDAFFEQLSPETQTLLEIAAKVGMIAFAFSALKGPVETATSIFKLLKSPLGKIAVAAAFALGGISELTDGFKKWRDDGQLNIESLESIERGVALLGIALVPFNPLIGGIIAIVGIAALFITQKWEAIKKAWDTFMEPIKAAVANWKQAWTDAFDAIATAINNALQALNNFLQTLGMSGLWTGGGGNGGGGTALGGWTPPGKKAAGGYVSEGQLFVAREAGPELVGTMGGRTAVANNDQIVAGISAGVYEAVVAAMGGGGGSGTPVIINLDGREIARSTTKYQNQLARARG